MTTMIVTASTELMSNFKQVDLMAPDADFAALQTAAGLSLLFSIGSDGAFRVTEETPGQATGWTRSDLGAGALVRYPAGTAKAKTFAVAENTAVNTIDMVLVVRAAAGDDLYVCLGNSTSDTGWLQAPAWVKVPYDDASHAFPRLVISDVMVSQASDGQYIVADVLRDPSDPTPLVFRYYIDPSKTVTGAAWNPHDVAVDIDASKTQSCLGRRPGDGVDALYTLGVIAGTNTLVVQPLYNVFNPKVPANPARLALPNGVVGTALAAAALTGDATDLFVAGGPTLYRFPAARQHDGSAGVAIVTSALFSDARALFAFAGATAVTVWGLNRAGQVFYTRCDLGKVDQAGAWSEPLPIGEGVEHISPYLNRIDQGNTFFAHLGGDRLRKAVQSIETTVWRYEDILLPAAADAKARKFNSYTTRLQVTDGARQPLAATAVQVSAAQRAGVYVNGHYVVLDVAPVPVVTDGVGGIVVVEWLDDGLTGTALSVHAADGSVVPVNPMDKPFQRAAALNTAAALSGAVITDKTGATRPLVPKGTSEDDLKVAATALGTLSDAYKTLPGDGSRRAVPRLVRTATSLGTSHVPLVSYARRDAGPVRAQALAPMDFGDAIAVFAGDLLNWLKDAASYVVHIVKDIASNVWHFVAEIGGKFYTFVLDAVDKVVGALQTVFDAIKTAIQDLIDYLKFLFAWKDFVRTKDVIKQILKFNMLLVLDGLDGIKADFNGLIDAAKTKVDDWAAIKADGWKPGVVDSGQPLAFLRTITDIEQALSAPAMFLFNHFSDNAGGSKLGGPPSAGPLDQILDRALLAVQDQGGILIGAIDRLRAELIDNSAYASLSLLDILKKLTAIVVDALLNTTENVVDSVIDVLVVLGRAVIDALDAPIWIPVVSDILQDVFNVTISFSLLDVVAMIGAVPATLVYKAAVGSAPFSPGDFSDKILAAKDPWALAAMFGPPRQGGRALALADGDPGKTVATWAPITLSDGEQRAAFIVGHVVAGIGAMVSALLSVPAALSDADNASYETAITVAGVVGGAATAVGAIFAAPLPIQNAHMARLATAATALTIIGKVGFGIGPYAKARSWNPDPAVVAKFKKVGAGFDALFATIALVPTCYHFYELANAPASTERTEACLEETSAICSDLSRITAFAAMMDKEPVSKAVLVAIMGALIVLYGGLQIGEAIAEAANKPALRFA
jgi:hypothetical protein